MINILLTQESGYKWFHKEGISVKGYIISQQGESLREELLVEYFSKINSFEQFQAALKNANGLFSVIIKKDTTIWTAVDIIRSFPLFYYHHDRTLFISDHPDNFTQEIPFSLDEESAILFKYSGYVPGKKTLWKDVFQIQAGECIEGKEDSVECLFYFNYLTNHFPEKSFEEWKAHLRNVLDNVGTRLIKTLNNRPVILPLTGGLDSRLIAYWLKKHQYHNVHCITYGKKDTPERANAECVAKQLGFNWQFIEHADYYREPFLTTEHFARYNNYFTKYVSIPFMQEYFPTIFIKENAQLAKSAVFIPGHSGDSIAGSHLREYMNKKMFSPSEYIVSRHFNFHCPKRKELRVIRKYIREQHKPVESFSSFLQFENWILKERQAKYIANSSHNWDFCGNEFLLPLWDFELVDFFRSVPFEYKLEKMLYREVLSELFDEYSIHFKDSDTTLSKSFTRKVELRKTLKQIFPSLNRFNNIWLADNSNLRIVYQEFLDDMGGVASIKDFSNRGGIPAMWYLEWLRKK